GYGPMMVIFVARISRGRTIRQLVTAVSVIAPVIAPFWFTVVGGTGLFQEILNPGSVSEALNNNGPPAAMMATTDQVPYGFSLACDGYTCFNNNGCNVLKHLYGHNGRRQSFHIFTCILGIAHGSCRNYFVNDWRRWC